MWRKAAWLTIIAAAQAAEALNRGSHFELEPWERPERSPNPGRGLTAVLEGGSLLEKVVYGSYIRVLSESVCSSEISIKSSSWHNYDRNFLLAHGSNFHYESQDRLAWA